MPNYQVIFFEKGSGDCPAEDFINSLDDKMSAKIYRLITMISENGPELREPYSKHLEDGIFELRARHGSNITRVMYFFMVRRMIVLTNGFIKKTQKTPRSEIETAKAYRKEHLEKEANHGENL
ncbi:MAG: type II toxin-antitoxin system RelE/ParE family toxin [Oscillospiraceae bacterium]|nr:type II toxin-antitoxin system RelE/ParE family toxin [Oscillospiraceae bacterium]